MSFRNKKLRQEKEKFKSNTPVKTRKNAQMLQYWQKLTQLHLGQRLAEAQVRRRIIETQSRKRNKEYLIRWDIRREEREKEFEEAFKISVHKSTVKTWLTLRGI